MPAILKTAAAACLIFVLFSACRSTRTIQSAISKIDTAAKAPLIDLHADSMHFIRSSFDSILKHRIDFNTFSAKIKVDLEGKDGKKSDFNAFLRLQKDSVLWVSINVALGVEAFRILITPDSVKILNKIDKVVQLRSVQSLQEITHLPFTFAELQNVIIGNAVFLDSNILSYNSNDRSISLFSVTQAFKHMLTIRNDSYLLMNSKLDDIDINRSRTCLVLYDSYQQGNGRYFPAFRQITVSEKSRLDIKMDYKQYEFNNPLSFPFSIPKNYKQN